MNKHKCPNSITFTPVPPLSPKTLMTDFRKLTTENLMELDRDMSEKIEKIENTRKLVRTVLLKRGEPIDSEE